MTTFALSSRTLTIAIAASLILVAAAAYIVLAAGGDDSGETNSPEAFLDRVEAALSGLDGIPYVTGETAIVSPDENGALWTSEAWYDLDADVVRAVWRKAPDSGLDVPDETDVLRTKNGVYVHYPDEDTEMFDPKDMPRCLGAATDELIENLFCGLGPMEGDAERLEVEASAEFRGVEVYSLAAYMADGRVLRLLVDRESYLPVGQTMTVQLRGRENRIETGYTISSVDPDSLPPDFFQPDGIGFVPQEEQWLQVLDDPALGVSVYWPGRTIAGTGQYDAVLTHVDDRRGPRGKNTPGHVLTLTYEGGNGIFRLDYWPGATWDEFKASLGDGFLWSKCTEETTSTVPGGELTVLRGHEVPGGPVLATPFVVTPGAPIPTPEPFKSPFENGCPDGAFDRFMAVVRVEGAVVTINAPYGLGGDGQAFGVFDTEEGLKAIAERLQLRQPGE